MQTYDDLVSQQQPTDHDDPGIWRLRADAHALRGRLRRVTVALALTEEVMADTFERMARNDPNRLADYLAFAERARANSVQCRSFVSDLDALLP